MTDNDLRQRGQTPESDPSTTATTRLLRKGLLVVLVVGLVGTVVELLLLKHTDGPWALIPVVLVTAAITVLVWFGASRAAASIRVLQALMLLFLMSGVLGTVLHLQANVEFERDSNPSVAGRELVQLSLAGATPTLAPGTMIQLGLVGLLFAFRHPSLHRRGGDESL